MAMDRNIYNLLADVLDYPTSGIVGQAAACSLALRATNVRAQGHFETFSKFCTTVPVSHLEELYTDTFDLQAVCSPYVGFHLFGEDRGRGMFMVKLKEHYAGRGHQPTGELPDHISVMFRFLALPERGNETLELISCCLIPAVKKMVSLFKDRTNAYQGVVEAALAVLEQERGSS